MKGRIPKVVGVIAVLALVRLALPRFRNDVTTRSAAAAMKSMLRNVVSLRDSLSAARQPLDSAAMVLAGYRAVAPGVYAQVGEDVAVHLRILSSSEGAFAAEARSERLADDARCAVWLGSAAPPIAGAEEGAATCEKFYEPLLGRERLRQGLGPIF